ncbi:hypothetical protein K0651_01850 [Ornithinimicrobium sp. Arc0846-15]|nr:hypothetical protein [Ornithinimicrobium laminariae]
MAKKKQQQGFRTWDSYVAESKKRPFELKVNAEQTLLIQQPSGQLVLELNQMIMDSMPSALDLLGKMLGEENWEVLRPLVLEAPSEVMDHLVSDIGKHFELPGFTDDQDGDESGEAPTRT